MTVKPGPDLNALPTDETPPKKRRGRPPGSKNKKSGASLKKEIGGTLTLLNMAVQMTPYREDALDHIEIEALTNAIDEQAKTSPMFRQYLEYVVKTVSGSGSLIGVVAMIGARRAARHGILPREADGQLGGLLAFSMGMAGPTSVQPTEPPN